MVPFGAAAALLQYSMSLSDFRAFIFRIRHDSHDRTVVDAIESMVISWTHLVQKILKEDSAELLLKGLNPESRAQC